MSDPKTDTRPPEGFSVVHTDDTPFTASEELILSVSLYLCG